MELFRKQNTDSHFNNLTPSEDERLACLIEECSELGKEIAIALFHDNKGQWETVINRKDLAIEIGQLNHVACTITEADLYGETVHTCEFKKKQEIQKRSATMDIDHWLLEASALINTTIRMACKCMRHGYKYHCEKGTDETYNNKMQLSQALGEMNAAVNTMGVNLLDYKEVTKAQKKKEDKLVNSLHHKD